jgi:hypothetical protein
MSGGLGSGYYRCSLWGRAEPYVYWDITATCFFPLCGFHCLVFVLPGKSIQHLL